MARMLPAPGFELELGSECVHTVPEDNCCSTYCTERGILAGLKLAACALVVSLVTATYSLL